MGGGKDWRRAAAVLMKRKDRGWQNTGLKISQPIELSSLIQTVVEEKDEISANIHNSFMPNRKCTTLIERAQTPFPAEARQCSKSDSTGTPKIGGKSHF